MFEFNEWGTAKAGTGYGGALKDSVSFEWWDGLSSMQACPEAFTKYVEELEK